jgi:nucleotide-binding universal stress UspA family protein
VWPRSEAERFRLPVTTATVDQAGHTPTAEGPLLLCYDGSDDAAYAIERAGELFAGRHAIVVTVWQSAGPIGSLAWSGALDGIDTVVEADRAAADHARRLADAGVRVAEEGGLEAEPGPVKATGPVSATILELADRHDAAAIVLGSRGLTGIRSILLGAFRAPSWTAPPVHRSSSRAPRPTVERSDMGTPPAGNAPAVLAVMSHTRYRTALAE